MSQFKMDLADIMHLNGYFGNKLYSTCAICALVEVLAGKSLPLLPVMVPVPANIVMASFAHDAIWSASLKAVSGFPAVPSGSSPIAFNALYNKVNIS